MQDDSSRPVEHEEGKTITVRVPEKGFTKVSYVNTRGASLNYVTQDSRNRESAHCSDRSD
jgi:hypothetical protein